MTAPSAAPARIYQVGVQADIDTPAAATARLAVPEMEFEATDDVNRPHLVDSMVRSPGHEIVQTRGTTWRVPAHNLTFEQVAGWLAAALQGGVSGVQSTLNGTSNEAVTYGATTMTDTRLTEVENRWVGATITADGKTGVVTANTATVFTVASWVGGTPTTESAYAIAGLDYAYNFTRNPNAYPSTDLLTFERRLTNYTDHIDEAWHKAAATRITISGQRNGMVQIMAEGFAGRRKTRTLTSSIPMPAVEQVPFPMSRLDWDTSWATRGQTPLVGKVLSWSWSFMTGAVAIPTADLNEDLDYDVVVFDGNLVGVEFTARVMQDKTYYEAERAAAEAQALRAARIEIHGTGYRRVLIDSLLKYERASISQVAQEDGQVVFDITARETTDATNFAAAQVINHVDGDVWGIPD